MRAISVGSLLVAVAVALHLGAAGAFANTEHLVYSGDGQRPYLIVTPDDGGTATRDLGVYVADAQGLWSRIFSGKLLSGRTSNGILTQLPLHKEDGRYYAMAVIDGKLNLFHIHSKQRDRESYAEFGSLEYPLLDLLHGAEIEMPKIESLEDVELAVGTATKEGETVLVSLKYKSLHGDGITFAFFVKRGESKDSRLQLAGPPMVIDYKFQEQSRLRALITENMARFGVVSRLLFKSFSRSGNDDPPAFQEWRRQLVQDLAQLDMGLPIDPSAYFDIKEGKKILAGQLKVELGTLQHNVQQIYDPLSGMDGLHVNREGNDYVSPTEYDLVGRIEVDYSDFTPKYRFYESPNDEGVALLYFNRELYVAWESTNLGIVKLDKAGVEIPKDIAFTTVVNDLGDEGMELYILLATDREKAEATECLVVREKNGIYRLTKRFPIYNDFLEVEELASRTHREDGLVLFDNLSQKYKTIEAYEQAFMNTNPLLDLTKTEANALRQAYLSPLEEREINQFLTFRDFESKGAIVPQSGLYLNDRYGKNVATVYGQLLQRPSQTQVELASKSVTIAGGVGMRLSLLAVDAGHVNGEEGFRLALTASYDSDGPVSNAFTPWLEETNFNLPFADLSGVQIFQMGGKKKVDTVFVLLRFDAAKNGQETTRPGGVFVMNYKVGVDKKAEPNNLTMDKIRGGWLMKGDISESELKHRLRRGANDGTIYFVVDPDIDVTSTKFKIQELSTGKEILPNASGERPIKLVSGDDDKEGADDRGFGFQKSASWEVYSMFKLRERNPKLFPEGQDDNIKNLTKADELMFPGLQGALDQMANPNAPPQHTVLVVSPHLKSSLYRLIWAIWADRDRAKHNFCTGNWKLKMLSVDPNRATQDEVLDNLDSARETATKDRLILLADMKDVLAIDRPTIAEDENERPGFTLAVPAIEPGADETRLWPHLMYLLQTEGDRMSLSEFSSAKSRRDVLSTIIVSTPDEWAQLQDEAKPEIEAGMLRSIVMNTRFFHGTWKTWGPNTPNTSNQVKEVKNHVTSEFEREVFPSLTGLMNDFASTAAPPKHKVLLVPAELKNSVQALILARWIQNDPEQSKWSVHNPNLLLYNLDATKATKQEEILENLDAIRSSPDSARAVLMADLNDIVRTGRSYSTEKEGFRLNDIGVGATVSGVPTANVSELSHTPHLLYLMETEGQRLQLADWDTEPPQSKTGLLLVGTSQEWEALKKDLNPEGRIGLADRFEIEELPIPSIDARIQLLKNVMKRPQIQGLRYKFDASKVIMDSSTLTDADAEMDAVLRFMVNKCELLAKQSNKEVITTFIQFLNVFTFSVIEDEVLRRRRVIDRVFVERLYSKVFSLPLNISVLPPEDPLVKLNHQNAVLDLQAAGYEGPIELKQRVIHALLAQTRVDPVRPIPSSIILYGDTGSGKTFLFKSICKMLGLKMYDFAKPMETDVQAIIINVGKLKPNPKAEKDKNGENGEKKTTNGNGNGNGNGSGDHTTPSSSEVMTVDQAIAHINHFLSLPYGYRGHILFDDLHLSSDEVRAQIVTYLRSLLESTNGMYRVSNFQNKVVEIPVRNLSIYMTLNPPDDVEKLKKFQKKGDDLEVVLAGLSGTNVPVDRSFLERWSLIINLSLFPSEAKAPKLRDSAREAARDTFNNQNQLVLVSPAAINSVATRFKDENARTFLSRATPELVARVSELPLSTPFSIVVPRDAVPRAGFFRAPPWEAAGRSGTDIEPYIKENLVAIAIGNHYHGRLELLKMVVDTYRIQAMGNLVRSIAQDVRFAGNLEVQRKLMAHLMHALVGHLTQNPYIPLSSLNLDPFDFGAAAGPRKAEFARVLQRQSNGNAKYFPFIFGDEIGARGLLDELVGNGGQSGIQRTRAEVLSEAVDRASPHLTKFLEELLRVDSVLALPKPDEWCKSLHPSEPTGAYLTLGTTISEQFLDFYGALFDNSLLETTSPQRFADITTYDAARMYFYVLDKAIAKLPWGKVTSFLVRGLELASSDMGMGQLQGVQHYIFSSKASLLRGAAPEVLVQMAGNSEAFKGWSEEQRTRASTNFVQKCSTLLAQP